MTRPVKQAQHSVDICGLLGKLKLSEQIVLRISYAQPENPAVALGE